MNFIDFFLPKKSRIKSENGQKKCPFLKSGQRLL